MVQRIPQPGELEPTVVGYTRRDIDTWASVVARSIRAAGGHLDALAVHCELRADVADNVADNVDALASDLQHRIKTYIGVTTTVTLLPAQGIERSLTGKARRVVDKRPKNQ
jgi:phenylacetate-coenzyme A ligase PaaK-like adenylate-forming protein